MPGEENPHLRQAFPELPPGPAAAKGGGEFAPRRRLRQSMPGTIERLADTIAALLAREGLDYLQTKAVFKAARQKAGLKAPKARKSSPARLSLEEELRFIDQAYARGGQLGLMMQTLLETGTRVSEFTALRVEDVSLTERVVTIEDGKGGKCREVPIRAELARLLALHIGKRRAGPLFPSREKGRGAKPRVYSRQRIGPGPCRGVGRNSVAWFGTGMVGLIRRRGQDRPGSGR